MKKGFLIILFLLVGGGVYIYKIIKSYNVSILDLENEKQKKINGKKFNNDIKKENNELKDIQTPEINYTSKLDIVGDEGFVKKVKDSLKILWTYDKNGSFRIVRSNVFRIIQSNRTTFFYYDDLPVIEISNEMYKNSSETYLASVIAHMGWHAWYLKNKKKKTIEVPHPSQDKIDNTPVDIFGKIKRFDDLYKVEEEAFNYQLSVLEKINAPQSEIKMLKKRNYKDFSLSHDGNYFIEF
jgi:hypothetical protein